MIRITELPLPLDYTPEALRAAVVKRLKIRDAELLEHTLFKRSYDARKKNTGILFICIVDVKVADEAAVLKRFAQDRQIGLAPDTSLSPGRQSAGESRRATRSSIGFGPGRVVCCAVARADGVQAHRARARPRCAAPNAGHLGAVAQERVDARIQRAIWRGRGGPVLRWQALQPDQGSEVLRPQGHARIRARRRAARDPLRQQAAHRHVPAHRHRREDARGNHRARRRGAFRKQGHRCVDRGWPASKA